jgi:hypothetical protein
VPSKRRSSIIGPAAWLLAFALGGAAGATAADEVAPPTTDAGATPAAGEEASAGEPAGESPHDPRALEVARRMADALSGARALRMSADLAYDAVQADGQAIEFGATRSIAIRRPDRARVDAVDRSGARRHMVFDGRQIAFSDESRQVYATAPFEGELDAMLDHVHDVLQIPTPLGEFLATNLFELLSQSDSAEWVDEQILGGVACDHVAFRNAETGLQLWVPREGEPLPRRVVITYEQAAGRPQFRADLRDWELSPALDDALFAFTPAEGAERIYFRSDALLPPGVSGMPGQGQEEGR